MVAKASVDPSAARKFVRFRIVASLATPGPQLPSKVQMEHNVANTQRLVSVTDLASANLGSGWERHAGSHEKKLERRLGRIGQRFRHMTACATRIGATSLIRLAKGFRPATTRNLDLWEFRFHKAMSAEVPALQLHK